MDKIFLAIYRFFKRKKWLMYTTLILTTAIFAYGASQIEFEENIFKLLPQTDKATESGVAFGDVKVKDKMTLQFVATKETVTLEDLAALEEEFIENLLQKDSATHYIDNCLYRFDNDDAMNAYYYAIDHLQAYVNHDLYVAMDTLLTMEKFDSFAQGGYKSLLPDADGGFKMIDGYFFAPDSSLALAFVAPAFNSIDSKRGGKLVKMLENEIAHFEELHPECEVMYHGAVVTGAYNSRQIKKDVVKTITLSLVAILLIVGFCFKNVKSLLQLLAPVVYGALCALACVYFIKGSMSMIAIGIGAMILGAALSYCLHVLTHHKYVGDPERVIREQATPVCLGCITTIGAFMGLLLTNSELLKDFGIFATFALIGTTFFALVYLPHFLENGEVKKNEKAFAVVNKVNAYPLYRKKLAVVVVSVACILSLFVAHHVGFDSNFYHIGYNSPQELKAKAVYGEKVNRNLKSKYYAAFAQDLDEAILISRQLNKKMAELKEQGVVKKYTSISDFLPTLEEQQNNIDEWKAYWTPQRVEEVGDLLDEAAVKYQWNEDLDIPGTFRSVVEAECEPESITDAEVLPDALMSNFIEHTDAGYLVFTSALMPEEEVTAVGDAISSIGGTVVIDPYYYTGDMIEIIHSDFNTVLFISSVFVFVVLLLSFKSIFTTLLAFLPMFFSWFVVEGVMAVCGIEFNLISIMISSFIFGIGVDYSIFMVDGLINEAKSGSRELLIYHKAAIIFSIFALLVVTCSLLFATHPAIHSVGVSTIIGMIATILITYAIQPLLFKLLMKNTFLRNRILHYKKS